MRRKVFWLVAVAWVTSVPSVALAGEANLLGYWRNQVYEDPDERGPGPLPGQYDGLPITDGARFNADSWDTSILSMPEHQCKPHPAQYGPRGPGQMRIWEDRDPETQQQVAVNTYLSWMETRQTIWMDGRPHPPEYAPHTWQGFSTGKWEGDALVVTTTHLKRGWLRRNGVFATDHSKVIERFIRHGDYLIVVTHVEDPHVLTEPMLWTTGFKLIPNGTTESYPCRSVVELPRPPGVVPSLIAEENNSTEEFARERGVPVEGARGGAATMYPEWLYSEAGRQSR